MNLQSVLVGHEVSVVGKIENGDSATIRATYLRDLSISTRKGDFGGTVTSIVGNNISISLRNNNTLTVISDGAKIVDRQGNVITLGLVKIGDRIKAKGVWNGANKTLTSVTLVRDLSLPIK